MKGGSLSQRGILNPTQGEQIFTLTRHPPPTKLAPFVERYWLVNWDLRDKPPYEQETLPYPCVNLVFGTHRPGLHGVTTTRFVAHLEGEGWVLGVKFRPAAFRPFWHQPVSTLTDRVLDVAEAFGPEGAAADQAIYAATSQYERIKLIETFLEARNPALHAEMERTTHLVETMETSSITRVDAFAETAAISVRMLQRLFDEYVGVPPKWVLCRFRVHEAAERVARRLARGLGVTRAGPRLRRPGAFHPRVQGADWAYAA